MKKIMNNEEKQFYKKIGVLISKLEFDARMRSIDLSELNKYCSKEMYRRYKKGESRISAYNLYKTVKILSDKK